MQESYVPASTSILFAVFCGYVIKGNATFFTSTQLCNTEKG